MELIFSYISGIQGEFEDTVYFLNVKASTYFENKNYSSTFHRLLLVLIPITMNTGKENEYRVKVQRVVTAIGLSIYLNFNSVWQRSRQEIITYVREIVPLKTGSYVGKDFDAKKLTTDLNDFFQTVLNYS